MLDRSHNDRWWQLLFGFIAMMAISSPQYVWTLFVGPLGKQLGGSLAALQVTFLLLIVLQTFFSPFQAYFVERFGPRLLISLGAAFSGLSWIFAAHASSLFALYLSYGVLGGIGTGIIYVGIIGLMVRWFPDRRGLAAGVTAAGYGAGAIVTTFPISNMLATSGYAHTLVVFGAIQGVVGVLAAQGLRTPPATWIQAAPQLSAAREARQTRRSFSPREMVRTQAFWLLFVNDEPHVDERSHDCSERRSICERVRRRDGAGLGRCRTAALADDISLHERTYAAVFRLGFGSHRP